VVSQESKIIIDFDGGEETFFVTKKIGPDPGRNEAEFGQPCRLRQMVADKLGMATLKRQLSQIYL
jgi:hypothetical protein